MEKVARPLRVCLTGAESTGKSELAKRLAAHFSARLVPEYSRDYALKRPNELSYSDVGPIARGQVELEDAALHGAGELLILDTDVLSTVAYSRHHFGACPEWVEALARDRLADFYLLLHIDVPWVWDPVRDSRHTRESLQDEFRRALDEFRANYTLISGTWAEREECAIEAIKRACRRANL